MTASIFPPVQCPSSTQ